VTQYNKNNIFAKIINGETKAQKLYEDEHVLAIADLFPQAPTHVLILPKGEYTSIHDFSTNAKPEVIAHFFKIITQLAEKFELHNSGYRLIMNHGADGMQTVPHFHVHLLGKKKLGPLIVGDNYHK
jgi:diadenosine tetraphosphate (Ap4A) HIT family hydrolase